MDDEETEVSLELADESHPGTQQAAEDAARLLIDVRDQRKNQDQNGHESSDSIRVSAFKALRYSPRLRRSLQSCCSRTGLMEQEGAE